MNSITDYISIVYVVIFCTKCTVMLMIISTTQNYIQHFGPAKMDTSVVLYKIYTKTIDTQIMKLYKFVNCLQNTVIVMCFDNDNAMTMQ